MPVGGSRRFHHPEIAGPVPRALRLGMMMSRDWPGLRRREPERRSAPGFQKRITPSRSATHGIRCRLKHGAARPIQLRRRQFRCSPSGSFARGFLTPGPQKRGLPLRPGLGQARRRSQNPPVGIRHPTRSASCSGRARRNACRASKALFVDRGSASLQPVRGLPGPAAGRRRRPVARHPQVAVAFARHILARQPDIAVAGPVPVARLPDQRHPSTPAASEASPRSVRGPAGRGQRSAVARRPPEQEPRRQRSERSDCAT